MDFLPLLMQVNGGGRGGLFLYNTIVELANLVKKNVSTIEIMKERARDGKKLVSEAANWSRLLLLK